jgi:hypothetical protein
MIIDVTGASSYHGFLPSLVRTCITNLTLNASAALKKDELNPAPTTIANLFPLQLATALFSFLYHLASYEAGAESLVACGMMESLLRVINWSGNEFEHITFVTRAVRVIDLITNIDMQSFQLHDGLNSFIERLNMEVNLCRVEQPYEIVPNYESCGGRRSSLHTEHRANQINHVDDILNYDETSSQYSDSDIIMTAVASPPPPATSSEVQQQQQQQQQLTTRIDDDEIIQETTSSSVSSNSQQGGNRESGLSGEVGADIGGGLTSTSNNTQRTKTCLPQRGALLKSMLNFLKKAIQDQAFSENIRHIMETTLPNSLKHIISNAEYYGPSLFLLATDVVTVYVFQEPSLLSSLQDSGLTDIVLQALLKKDVPATREVLGSLPNVFSALCLNARGLASFIKYNPFDKLFQVLLSPLYLSAMRRRRSSDPMGDTASNLGNAMDELMRNQSSLKTEATKAIIKLLEDLVHLGTNPKYICWRANVKSDSSQTNAQNQRRGEEREENAGTDTVAGSSDEDDDDEEEASTSSHHNQIDHENAQQGGATIIVNDPTAVSRLVVGTVGVTGDVVLQNDNSSSSSSNCQPPQNSERIAIGLIDYILNVMKFVNAILSNNSTDDHCREFVAHGGLQPLLSILALPNLPVTNCYTPVTASFQVILIL